MIWRLHARVCYQFLALPAFHWRRIHARLYGWGARQRDDSRAACAPTASRPDVGSVMPSLNDEVAFISNVNADGTLALDSYGAWNPGTIPADYSGGYTIAM